MYRVVFNLRPIVSLQCYLPQALVVTTHGHTLGTWKAQAVPDYLTSYGIDPASEDVGKLCNICQDLSTESLEKRYQGKQRRKMQLEQLYQDDRISHTLMQYVAGQMKAFYAMIEKYQHPLVLDASRRQRLEDLRLSWGSVLEPLLHFDKTQTGIHYRLQLQLDGEPIQYQRETSVILLDQPGIICIDATVYRLHAINANKVRPFLSKDSIFIKQAMIKQYFKSFIVDMAKTAAVEATGFDIIELSTIQHIELCIRHNYMLDRYMLDLKINYGRGWFYYSDRIRSRTQLEMSTDDQVIIYKLQRSRGAEQFYVDMLVNKGLQLDDISNRLCTDDTDRYALVRWIVEHKDDLVQRGMGVPRLEIDGSVIAPVLGQWAISTTRVNDWFDIEGIVTIGKYEVPFIDLLPNIKAQNPLYLLPDGTCYLIPTEWLATYSAVSRVGTVEGDRVRILKSQSGVLASTDIVPLDTAEQDSSGYAYEQHPHLLATLRPYQQQGVVWLIQKYSMGLGAVLADDMGLGKTIQTLALLNYVKDHVDRAPSRDQAAGQLDLFAQERAEELKPLRALIILPSSLVFNWYREIKVFSPRLLVTAYTGPDRKERLGQIGFFDIVLTTYTTAMRDAEDLGATMWEYIILDESHVIKNRHSKTFKAVQGIPSHHRLALTGTPIENALSDLWSQMDFINPGMLSSYEDFESAFVLPIGQGDPMALDQLRQLVQPHILRRRKTEVAKDLPALQEIIVEVIMGPEQASMYEETKSKVRNQLLAIDGAAPEYQIHALTALLQLRQLANHPKLIDDSYRDDAAKLDAVMERLAIIRDAGNKILVFSSFTTHLDVVAERLEQDGYQYCRLTGASSPKQRQQAVDRFKKVDAVGVFLISIKAGGTGLNLTEASYVFLLDPWWNPFVEEQAKARSHRIGQQQAVTVYKFITKDTIEEKILALQAKKKVQAAELIEGQDQIKVTKALLADLLG